MQNFWYLFSHAPINCQNSQRTNKSPISTPAHYKCPYNSQEGRTSDYSLVTQHRSKRLQWQRFFLSEKSEPSPLASDRQEAGTNLGSSAFVDETRHRQLPADRAVPSPLRDRYCLHRCCAVPGKHPPFPELPFPPFSTFILTPSLNSISFKFSNSIFSIF